MAIDTSAHQALFYQEAEELLELVQSTVLLLEEKPHDRELINSLFRAFHTIKGSAAVVGLDDISGFTHHVETTLDHVRMAKAAITPALVTQILAAKDHLALLLAAGLDGRPVSAQNEAQIVAELAKASKPLLQARRAVRFPPDMGPDAVPTVTTFDISFKLGSRSSGVELDPNDILGELRTLGPCLVTCFVDGVVLPLSEQQGTPERWFVSLTTTAPESRVRDVFIFFEADDEVIIERGLSEFIPDDLLAPSFDFRSSRYGHESGDHTAFRGDLPPLDRPKNAAVQSTVRVPAERLDQLVKLVGELVINQSRLTQAFNVSGHPEMAGPVESMERLIAGLRDTVFGIRMMPIGTTFDRFRRMVRDLATDLGKEIDLVTEGAETELDKTVLDQLADPLVHLIRNSMDHGIEVPDDRVAQGKPRRGTVRLRAAHDGGHVVLTISDDGRGLDKAAIRAKAEERGLIDSTTRLGEQEVFGLVMQPGFSTATAITQVSGRGVGMDVVKKTIESLRGTIRLSSVQGLGTTIALTLPLTLAIIDGLLVEIAKDRFIVPMSAVTENVELGADARQTNNGRHAVAVRGELVPYIRLRDLFSIAGQAPTLEKVVIVSLHGERVGLVVDQVVGSHQTVIQPLGPFYRGIDLFSGTTIMGDGRVAMILDLAGTVSRVEKHRTSERNLQASSV